MERYKELFSHMIADPTVAIKNQESLTKICESYPWFTIAKVIRLALYSNISRKREAVNLLAPHLVANNYYKIQQKVINTEYTNNFILKEKTGVSAEIDESVLLGGEVLLESNWTESDLFPKGRVVVTKSGLFYSEESEGYKIIKEVIAINQKIDEFGQKKSVDITAEIIDLFLSKDIERIKPKQTDIKEDSIDLSVYDTEEVITESMAKIYRLQGLTEVAIGIYNKLSLKYPEKNRYFAEIISLIREEEEKNRKNK